MIRARKEGPSVLVIHPGRQHSHQLAIALAQNGWLIKYITGVPAHGQAGGHLFRPFIGRYIKAYDSGLDPDCVLHNFVSPMVRKLIANRFSEKKAVEIAHFGDALFDRMVARQIAILRPDIVIGYENACFHTFRKANKFGITTILDAASLHHKAQDAVFKYKESYRAHDRITCRKDMEIMLADHVFTVSELARESYVSACPDKRVYSIPVGVDLELFSKKDYQMLGENDVVRFIFIGVVGLGKGADVLKSACRILKRDGLAFSLALVGGLSLEIDWDDISEAQNIGRIPSNKLADEIRNSDVLVMPSRHDSFGMVVAESMACGLPVILSDNVGAKEMVTEGWNGFVVPLKNAEALAEKMRWFIENNNLIPEMGAAANLTAKKYSWSCYHRRVIQVLDEISSDI